MGCACSVAGFAKSRSGRIINVKERFGNAIPVVAESASYLRYPRYPQDLGDKNPGRLGNGILEYDALSDSKLAADAITFTQVFLATPFSGEARHVRRLEMIADYERSGDLPPLPGQE